MIDPTNYFKSLTTFGKIVFGVFILIFVILAFMFVRDLFVGSKDVEAKLGTEQAGAAIESGSEAVTTLGENQREEDDINDEVSEGQSQVNEAKDATGAQNAFRDALCRNNGVCDDD
ncbi:MAG: hypothetical protein Unbinned4120contig1000_49 [Prokaryotic dsDNA virus sp.]|jgi:hypothetical protein|nr:MAG: hypothetical protein Unbinned4120contig1000_49 [Prokaryotic dsDNA virus sp.]|tara:strand:- start:25414 stop:25761 length:348 start_codon:yes stop_codon:yes gene_type:complete